VCCLGTGRVLGIPGPAWQFCEEAVVLLYNGADTTDGDTRHQACMSIVAFSADYKKNSFVCLPYLLAHSEVFASIV